MKISKKEKLLLIVVALIIVFAYLLINVFLFKSAGFVEITVDGKEYGVYTLDAEETIVIETERGKNTIVINNNSCHMEDASCPDKICQKQGIISKTNETITCLPNRVVIRAFNSNSQVDAMVK